MFTDEREDTTPPVYADFKGFDAAAEMKRMNDCERSGDSLRLSCDIHLYILHLDSAAGDTDQRPYHPDRHKRDCAFRWLPVCSISLRYDYR